MSPANVHSFPCRRSELLGLLRRHVPRPRAHGQRLDGHVTRGWRWRRPGLSYNKST